MRRWLGPIEPISVSLLWMLSLSSAKAETFFAACAWNKASPSAAEVKAGIGVDRAQLDLAWVQEEAASMCLLAESAPSYGDTFDPPCKDKNAPLKFLRRFKVSRKTDKPNASRLIGYFIAKAQAQMDQWGFAKLLGECK